MKHPSEAKFSDHENALEDDDDWISKSQLKRESKDIQLLGKKLGTLNPEQLSRVPLPENLIDALSLAHKIAHKHGAVKRQFQYIGKLLRSMDVEPIIQAVKDFEDADNSSKALFKKMEFWRDRIVTEGETAIDECCAQYPDMDRQKLRQLSRNHKNANTDAKRTRFARQIFQEIQACLNAQ